MENLDLEESTLYYLYCKSFGEGDATLDSLDKWAVQRKLNKVLFWEQYDYLIKKDFIHYVQDDGTVRLTPMGVLHTEKAGVAPRSLVAKNRQMRKQLLHSLAQHLDKRSSTITVDELVECSGQLGSYCFGNIELLVGLGYVRWIIPKVNLSINAKVCAKEAALTHAH